MTFLFLFSRNFHQPSSARRWTCFRSRKEKGRKQEFRQKNIYRFAESVDVLPHFGNFMTFSRLPVIFMNFLTNIFGLFLALVPLYEFEEPGVAMKYGVQTLDAELFSALEAASREKKLVVVMKVYWGDPRDKLSYAIDHVPLDHIVVGNRGLGKVQRLLLGSVSSYLVNNAPCPVTVVKLPADAAPS